MSYYINTILNVSFEDAIVQVTQGLQKEGFGIVTEIDFRATMKKKLDKDFRNYTILGACNPHFAYKALTEEDKIGVFLPCNIIVQEIKDGTIEVAAVDPVASMQSIKNEILSTYAAEVKQKLTSVIETL